MAVSPGDRARMRRLVKHFRRAETDEEPTPEVRRRRVAEADEWRLAHGIPPLREEDDDEPPELGLYRRARALGLRSSGG